MQSVPTNQIDSDFIEFLNSLDNSLENRSDNEKITLVKYGKGYLVKGTIEYDNYRERNQLATNKSRIKKQIVEKERKEKLKKIRNENNFSIKTQLELFEELDKLNIIFSQMATSVHLPIDFNKLQALKEDLLMMKAESLVEDKISQRG
jgi:hypothetical protein